MCLTAVYILLTFFLLVFAGVFLTANYSSPPYFFFFPTVFLGPFLVLAFVFVFCPLTGALAVSQTSITANFLRRLILADFSS
jgi:4-hydroxybenzoate polyprenyltransferase